MTIIWQAGVIAQRLFTARHLRDTLGETVPHGDANPSLERVHCGCSIDRRRAGHARSRRHILHVSPGAP